MVVMRRIARRPPVVEPATIIGPVKTDRRTRRLAGRLRAGDIALIDHTDLDRVSAEALVAADVAAVLNAKPSISGRYPNLGPELLVARGVPLLDDLGEGVFEHLREGTLARVESDAVLVNGVVVARGMRQDADRVATAMAAARQGITVSSVALLVAATLTAMAAAVFASTVGRPWLDEVARRWEQLMMDLQGLFQ
jgi:uncharacterized membrane-anchored protein